MVRYSLTQNIPDLPTGHCLQETIFYFSIAKCCTGSALHRETGKITKKIPVREFGNLAKTQGILFAQVVNSLILKVKNIVLFATRFLSFFLEAGYVSQISFVYVIVTNHVNWHRENLGSDRENPGSFRMEFE